MEKQGNLLEAEKGFLQTISFAPNDAELKINLAKVLFKGNRLNDALEQFNSAIKINPLDARFTYFFKSLMYLTRS